MDKNRNSRPLIAHLSMFGACAIWGLMAPLGKDAMTHGLDGITMVSMRVFGGMMLFWLTSLIITFRTKRLSQATKEHVPMRDRLMFCGAALFGLVFNQCCYTLGLSITSPINASIVTTSMPIFAMILAAIILREPITGKKALGVLTGCSGALILILTSAAATTDKVGDIRGDLLCLGAQFSFALYLSLFNPLIRRYSVFTINKWMFLWATLIIAPFTIPHMLTTEWSAVTTLSWWEAAYVVVFGTFIGYILTMIGQRTLRPTVVSTYNYVQPIVSVTVSIITGIGIFQWSQALAVVLVFTGVWWVTKSKSRRDMEREKGLSEPLS
ncbi:MAG: DMT family transporter [Prevotella sp.]|nr:DMT family transporter [Prevotella sp.]